jgi:hypothetical protein
MPAPRGGACRGRPAAPPATRSPRPGSPSATSWPLCSTMMRSASSRTTSILCSTSRMVLGPRALSSRIRSSTTGTSSTLMPAVGSSNMKTLGSSAISSATSSLRWSPCGSAAASSVARAARRTCSSMASASSIQALRRARRATGRCPPGPCRAARLDRQAHVLQHRQVGEQLRELEGPAQAAPRAQRRRQRGDVLAVQPAPARHWPAAARDQVEVGRLARAVGPHDGRERARARSAGHRSTATGRRSGWSPKR